jgi:long-chain acyl-CoA synthetase
MDASMNPVSVGELGEIAVRGSIQTPGYWKDPERSQQVLVNGWFRTGDLAILTPSGHIQMKGRNDDVINIGGKKVFPQEIEQYLMSHPSVQDCACCSVVNELMGEQIQAFIVSNDTKLSTQEWVNILRESLDSYKIPTQFEYVDSIPYTNTGKKKREALVNERAHKKP